MGRCIVRRDIVLAPRGAKSISHFIYIYFFFSCIHIYICTYMSIYIFFFLFFFLPIAYRKNIFTGRCILFLISSASFSALREPRERPIRPLRPLIRNELRMRGSRPPPRRSIDVESLGPFCFIVEPRRRESTVERLAESSIESESLGTDFSSFLGTH